MKVLLDECVPQSFCRKLHKHECKAARPAGFGGKKNGELLELAEVAGFEVLITVHKSIPYQQNLRSRTISLLIIDSNSNRIEDLASLAPACLEALDSIRPSEVLRVGSSPYTPKTFR